MGLCPGCGETATIDSEVWNVYVFPLSHTDQCSANTTQCFSVQGKWYCGHTLCGSLWLYLPWPQGGHENVGWQKCLEPRSSGIHVWLQRSCLWPGRGTGQPSYWTVWILWPGTSDLQERKALTDTSIQCTLTSSCYKKAESIYISGMTGTDPSIWGIRNHQKSFPLWQAGYSQIQEKVINLKL